MIIVSQDKYNLLNFDTTVNIGVEEITTLNDVVQISAQTNGDTIILGKYKNEERAKEVLQEIATAYSDFKYYAAEDGKRKTEIGVKIYQNYKSLDLYEMPKE